jgi:hypothetical protein
MRRVSDPQICPCGVGAFLAACWFSPSGHVFWLTSSRKREVDETMSDTRFISVRKSDRPLSRTPPSPSVDCLCEVDENGIVSTS